VVGITPGDLLTLTGVVSVFVTVALAAMYVRHSARCASIRCRRFGRTS
jgi:hypothetical protein